MTYPNTSNANGIWTLRDTFLARKGNIWPSAFSPNLDPFFDYVSLLLSMDGDDASTTFTDSSNNGLTVTANGNAAISTSESKFGQSAAFDGNGDRVSVANNAALDFGTGDFTVECWVRSILGLASYSVTYAHILGKGNGSGGGTYSLVFYNSKAGWVSNSSVKPGTSTLTNNTWYHFAACRSGSTLRLFVDGVQEYSGTDTTDYTSSESFNAGDRKASDPSLNYPLNGYIDDLRITKGFARYTADFTPPTLPFETASPVQLDPYFENYVSLLLHMDGANGSTIFTDESTNNLTVTANGNAAISTSESKFGGASAAFDGTGDYLAITDNAALDFTDGSDFTIEFWFYRSGTSGFGLFGRGGGAGSWSTSNGHYYLAYILSGALYVQYNYGGGVSTPISLTTTAPSVFTWNHFAMVRSSGTITAYLNGTSFGSSTAALVAPTTRNITRIGDLPSGSSFWNGYIDDFRITKGIARYTTNFTPPTKAFPDTLLTNDLYFDNVSLLLPMDGTNGSTTFTDESDNGLTVTANGNAQISTAQSKFGGASALFDGTGDYLSLPSSSAWAFGTADLTIEFWFRVASFGSGITYMSQATNATPSWYVYSDNSSSFRFGRHGDAQYNVCTTTLSLNTWYHVAIVRSGGVIAIYLNGQSQSLTAFGGGVGGFDFSASTALNIGALSGGSNSYNGNLDDIRITKGVARYTANFYPPTRAFPNE